MKRLTDFVKGYEGFRSEAYQDSGFIWTVGYGQTRINGRKVLKGDTTDALDALDYLEAELSSLRLRVIEYAQIHGYVWNDYKVEALTSFVYNLGFGTLDTLTAQHKRSNKEIANKIPLYHNVRIKGKLTPSKGLISRRNAEKEYFNGDV